MAALLVFVQCMLLNLLTLHAYLNPVASAIWHFSVEGCTQETHSDCLLGGADLEDG
jgi:hypothetical protein